MEKIPTDNKQWFWSYGVHQVQHSNITTQPSSTDYIFEDDDSDRYDPSDSINLQEISDEEEEEKEPEVVPEDVEQDTEIPIPQPGAVYTPVDLTDVVDDPEEEEKTQVFQEPAAVAVTPKTVLYPNIFKTDEGVSQAQSVENPILQMKLVKNKGVRELTQAIKFLSIYHKVPRDTPLEECLDELLKIIPKLSEDEENSIVDIDRKNYDHKLCGRKLLKYIYEKHRNCTHNRFQVAPPNPNEIETPELGYFSKYKEEKKRDHKDNCKD